MRKYAPLLALAALIVPGEFACAATYYAIGGNNWTATSGYTLNADGSGGNPSTFAGNVFYANGKTVGTGTTSQSFLGDAFNLDTAGILNVRGTATGGATYTMSSLNVVGNSTIQSGQSNNVTATNLNIAGSTSLTLLDNRGSGSTQINDVVNLGFTSLTGSGNIQVVCQGTGPAGYTRVLELTGASTSSASTYTGNITFGAGSSGQKIEWLQFGTDNMKFGGGLIANSASSNRIILDKNVILASATLDGVSLAKGTYTFAQLNAAHDALFEDGYNGSITIAPEPAALSLLAGAGMALLMRRRHR